MATAANIARWAGQAGWSGLERVTATAVGMAQGGNENAAGGVWGVGGNPGDGADQAKVAHAAVVKGGWNALPAFRNGRYLFFEGPASLVVTATAGADTAKDTVDAAGKAADTVAATGDALTSLANTAGSFYDYVTDPNTYKRILLEVAGASLIFIGLFQLTVRNVIQPGYRWFVKADEGALRVAELNENLIKPYKRYHRTGSASP